MTFSSLRTSVNIANLKDYKRIVKVCAILAFLCSGGCGEDSEDLVVATVGSASITQSELRSFVETLPPAFRSKKLGQDARKDYLQTLLDRELMLLEGYSRGLDSARVVVTSVREKMQTRLQMLYRASEVIPQVRISQEDLEARFRREELERERLAWVIGVKTREEIDKPIKELAAGLPFEEVAVKYSIDIATVRNGGLLGFFNISMARRFGIPDSIFNALPQGEISGPLPAAHGVYIIRFTEDRKAAIEEHRESLVRMLEQEKIGEKEAEVAEVLAQKLDWRLDRDGLNLLLQKGRETVPSAVSLSSEEADVPLCRFDGGQVTVADYLEALNKVGGRRGLEDSATVAGVTERLFLKQKLFAEAARREGLVDEEELIQDEEKEKEELMLTVLRKAEVTDAVTIAEEEIRRFYDEHLDRFSLPDTFGICEVLVRDEQEAARVRKDVEEGADLSQIARKTSVRRGARKTGGIMEFTPLDHYLYPQLLAQIETAEEGQLVGPAAVKGGYSVFRLDKRRKGNTQPYAEARTQVRAFVQRGKEQERFEVFIEGLRSKYGSQTQVFEERLEIALPDEFLASLEN